MKKSKKAIAILGLSAIMLLTTKKVAYAETYQITHNVAEYNHSSLKSYESYTVFDENYDQYELEEMAVTDENGFRMINGNYLVAIGSKFGVEIGQYFDPIKAAVLEETHHPPPKTAAAPGRRVLPGICKSDLLLPLTFAEYHPFFCRLLSIPPNARQNIWRIFP